MTDRDDFSKWLWMVFRIYMTAFWVGIALIIYFFFSSSAHAQLGSCSAPFAGGGYASPADALAAHTAARYPYQNSAVYCSGVKRVNALGGGQFEIFAECVSTSTNNPTEENQGIMSCAGSCTPGGGQTTGWAIHGTYDGSVFPDAPGNIATHCSNGCLRFGDGPSACQLSDTNANGEADAGDIYSCLYSFANSDSGLECVEGTGTSGVTDGAPNLTQDPPPNGNSYDCTNVDCSNPPTVPTPPDDDPTEPPVDPGAGPDPGDTDTGGNEDTGDGDPDTPGDGSGDPGGPGDDNSSGTGTGDTDGDGQREIDCNPFSNPDCQFRGSGQSTGDCSQQPTCTGDPVQCAILKQNWQAMCYPFRDDGSEYDQSTWDWMDTNPGVVLGDRVQEIDVANSLTLDESGYIAEQCPADEVINLPAGLGSMSVSYWMACDLATILSYLIMIAAYYMAFRIVSGAIGPL